MPRRKTQDSAVAIVDALGYLDERESLDCQRLIFSAEISVLESEPLLLPGLLETAIRAGDSIEVGRLEERQRALPMLVRAARVERQKLIIQILKLDRDGLQEKLPQLTADVVESRRVFDVAESALLAAKVELGRRMGLQTNTQNLLRDKHQALNQAQDELSKLCRVELSPEPAPARQSLDGYTALPMKT